MTATADPAAATLAELEREVASTRGMLAAVPADKLGWRPHERSMTLGELASHVANNFGGLAEMFMADGFDLANAKPTPVPGSVDEILASFDNGVVVARKALSNWTDSELAAEWAFTMGGQPLMKFTRAEGIRMLMFSHLVHHRGQLSVYLRLLDVPVPSVYGPTADVNPFA